MRVSGGSTALAEKLRRDVDYDGVKLIATGIVTTDQAGAIKSTHWVALGALKTIQMPAQRIWIDANKQIQVVIRIPDMAIFEFPATSNMSAWVDRNDLDIRFVNKTDRCTLDWEEARTMGVEDVIARAIIVPGSHQEATVWVAVVPLGKEELADKVGGHDVNHHGIPHISLPLDEQEVDAPNTFSAGKAVTATLIQQELPNQGFGMGTLAFIDCTTSDNPDQGNPDPGRYKEAVLGLYRAVSMGAPTNVGHFASSLQKFIDKTAPTMKKAPVVFPEYTRPREAAG
jgi:hypothetical protein